MSRKLFKKRFILAVTLSFVTLLLIYFLFYRNINDYDQFIVVKAIESDDDDISISKLVNFTEFQYKIKPDSLCSNLEDELLGKT